jgi:hypothetical protein
LLYRIAGNISPTEHVPPEAILGAWKIDDDAEIITDFMKNPNCDPVRFPPPVDASEQFIDKNG